MDSGLREVLNIMHTLRITKTRPNDLTIDFLYDIKLPGFVI